MIATPASTSLAAEIASGQGLTPPKLARELDNNPSTVVRWILRGIPDGAGGRVRLEALRRGRVWLTSRLAYARFLQAHPSNFSTCEPTPAFRSPAARERAGREADEALKDRYGI